MAIAGFNTRIQVGGTPTAFSAEATTSLGGNAYQMTDTAKQVFDPDTAVVIWDNGSPVADADIDDIDFMHGIVTFDSGYSPAGAITFNSGSYIPLYDIADGVAYDISESAEMLDCTKFGGISGGRLFRDRFKGIEDVMVSLDVLNITDTQPSGYDPTEATGSATLDYGTPNNGDTLVFTGPGGVVYTMTKQVATDYDALEFSSTSTLAILIQDYIPGLTDQRSGNTHTLSAEENRSGEGTQANAFTLTGTGTYSAVNITFSGGTQSLSWAGLKDHGDLFVLDIASGESGADLLQARGWFRVASMGEQAAVDGRIEVGVQCEGCSRLTQNSGRHANYRVRNTTT